MFQLKALYCLYVFFRSIHSAHGYIPGTFSRPSSSDGDPNSVYTDDPVWEVGSTQNLTWQSSCASIDLDIWQQANSSGQGSTSLTNLLSNVVTGASSYTYEWVVSVSNYNLDISPVFFFEVYCHNTNSYFGSHYVNITSAAVSSSTSFTSSSSSSTSSTSSSSSSASSTSASSSSTTSSTQTIPTNINPTAATAASVASSFAIVASATSTITSSTSTATTAPTTGDSTGLSVGAKAGIGAAAGAVAVLALLLFLIPRTRRALLSCCSTGRRNTSPMQSRQEITMSRGSDVPLYAMSDDPYKISATEQFHGPHMKDSNPVQLTRPELDSRPWKRVYELGQ